MNAKIFVAILSLGLCQFLQANLSFTVTDLGPQSGEETFGLDPSGLYEISNTPQGVYFAAISENSEGLFAGQTPGYTAYAGTSSGIDNLSSLLGPYAQIWTLNDSGTMVGFSESGIYSDEYQAFAIENGKLNWIPTLGGASDAAQAVSANNLVVGHSYDADGIIDAFLWSGPGSQSVDLGSLGGTHYFANTNRTFASDAWGVNSSGEVVGASWIADGEQRAFVYENSQMIDLGSLSGGVQSWANCINDEGLVVGGSTNAGGLDQATIWVNESLTDLNGISSGLAPGVFLTDAYEFNDKDEILSYGSDGDIYLLTPNSSVPSPGAFIPFAAAAFSALRRKKRSHPSQRAGCTRPCRVDD